MRSLTKTKILFCSAVAAAGLLAATQASAENFRLRIGAGHPPALVYVQQASEFFVPEVTRRVAEETDHNVRFIEAWAGSVAKLTEVSDATSKGILDIGIALTPFEQSRLYLLTYSYFFPFTSPDPRVQTKVAMRMLDEVPAMKQSVEGLGLELLAQSSSENYGIGTTEPWEKIEDLAGLKFAAAGSNAAWAEVVDGVAVQMGLGDNYTGMQTGLIDGNLVFASAYVGFKLHEVAKQFTNVDFGSFVSTAMLVNKGTMEELPPEVQTIIREVAREWTFRVAEVSYERQTVASASLKDLGMIVNEAPAEMRAAWGKRLADVPQKAAQEVTELGYDGAEIYKAYIAKLAEEGYQFPYPYTIE